RGDLLLAVLAELRPELCHRGIDVELAAARQHMRAERGRTLGAGKDDADRVARPRLAGLGIGKAAPQVDHRLAADRQADGGAQLAALRKVLLKSFGDALEARLARSLD